MCDNIGDTPFCSPQDGVQLRIGEILNINWNPLFFTNSPSFPSSPPAIFIQADFSLLHDINDNEALATTGFISSALDPDAGSFAWPILASYLPATANSTSALLSIAAPLPNIPVNGTFARIGVGTMRFPGPQIRILRESDSGSASPSITAGCTLNSSSSTIDSSPAGVQKTQPQQGDPPSSSQNIKLAIALPIALGVFTALLMAAYYFLVRRHSHRPPGSVAALLNRWRLGRKDLGRKGYGERQGGDHRIRGRGGKGKEGGGVVRLGGRDVEIKVVQTDLEGLRANAVEMGMVDGERREQRQWWDGNVFRKEILRQERERV